LKSGSQSGPLSFLRLSPELERENSAQVAFLRQSNYRMRHGFIPSDLKKLSFKGDCMKRLCTLVITLLVGATLSFAQAGGAGGGATGTTQTDTGKKGHKGSKKGHHKSGKKGKKGSTSTTPPPK
jgi:hypothetical protein